MLQYPELQGVAADLLDAGPVGEVALAAEHAGWHGLSFSEHPAPGARWLHTGGHQTVDPFVALGAAAATTRKLRLLTYLTVAAYRNPLLLAKAATTVDQISNGRFVLGAGTGYLKGEFRALGVDFAQRNKLLDEALEVLPLHWNGEPFSYDGEFFSARDVVALPRPVQHPIPIWLGGNSRLTLARVATRAQGWMPLLGSAEVAATTRTPHLDSVDSLAARLAMLRDLAGDRFAAIEVAIPYVGQPDATRTQVEQERDYFGRLQEVGIGWVIVAVPWAIHPATVDFIEGFASAHISNSP